MGHRRTPEFLAASESGLRGRGWQKGRGKGREEWNLEGGPGDGGGRAGCLSRGLGKLVLGCRLAPKKKPICQGSDRGPVGGAPPTTGGAVMEKKKTRSVQYTLRWRPVGNRWRPVGNRWRLVGNRWRLVGNRWRLVGNRWRLVGNRWRLVGNRWRLVGNRWRLVGSHQTSESGCHSKKKKVSVLMAPPAHQRHGPASAF